MPAGHRPSPSVIRRRFAVLLLALALPTALLLYGIEPAWALFALPLAVAMPLGGFAGLLLAIACSGSVVAVVSGMPGTDGAAMSLGLGVFAATGVIVGMGHAAHGAAHQRARHASFTDRLTDVPNEEFFLDALERESARATRYGTPFSVVVLDLDRFGDFNRRYGAAVGDLMIAAVGETVAATVRRCDSAARLHGAQFALIVPGTEADAAALAGRLVEGVSRLRVPASRGRSATATISLGIAGHAGGDDQHGTMLLDRAERALDDAKAGGRNRFSVYSSELDRWSSVA